MRKNFVLVCVMLLLVNLFVFSRGSVEKKASVYMDGTLNAGMGVNISTGDLGVIYLTGEDEKEIDDMKLYINETQLNVDWEENESVSALRNLCKKTPYKVQMSMYGGFEQVGSLGRPLPRKDVKMETRSGDVVLYSGSEIVIFYGSNTWSYTKLGRITNKTQEELTELLSNGDVVLTIE